MKLRTTICGLLIAYAASSLAGSQKPQLCEIRVSTTPSQATVFFDGEMQGESPLTIQNVKPGRHILKAQKPGFRTTRQGVSLKPGQKLPIGIHLDQIYGLLLIKSSPSGADVQIDGAARGKTPLLIIDISRGKHRLIFSSDGYSPKELEVNIVDDTPQKIIAFLASDSATLTVHSTPAGATVAINGIVRGRAPCTIVKIPTGECKIKLTLNGFEPHIRNIILGAGKEEKITTEMIPIPASLRIVSIPDKARIYVNNEFKGESPVKLTDLPPGSYRIRAELAAYEPLVRTIMLQRADSKVEEFRLEANCGTFEITTEPAGVKVLIDGKDSGVTASRKGGTDRLSVPLKIKLVPTGKRKILLTRSGYFNREVVIDMKKNETTASHYQLKRRFIPNCEVRTANDVYRGVLIEIGTDGSVKLETRPGIIKTILGEDVRSRKPLRDPAEENNN